MRKIYARRLKTLNEIVSSKVPVVYREIHISASPAMQDGKEVGTIIMDRQSVVEMPGGGSGHIEFLLEEGLIEEFTGSKTLPSFQGKNFEEEVRQKIDEKNKLIENGVMDPGPITTNLRVTAKGHEFLASRRLVTRVLKLTGSIILGIIVAVTTAAVTYMVTEYLRMSNSVNPTNMD